MRGLEPTVETRQQSKRDAQGGPQRLALVVFSGDSVASFPLPERGDVVIGRSREADCHVADDSLSRKHAVLKVQNGEVEVKDLGSQNGTKLNQLGVGSEWVPFSVGDALKLGDATAVLQQSRAPRAHRRLWSHGYFEARLEEECARGTSRFAVARVHVEERGKDATVAEALSRAMGPSDCLASYAPGELEALLIGVSDTEAADRADALVAALEPLGVAARAGVASFPKDGKEPERLLARACAEVAGRPEPPPSAKAVIIAAPAMKKLYEMVSKVGASDISVLILGETGAGKEVIARAVHDRSVRASKPYVALNCAAFTESLLESELFGHEKGAFTGATETRTGLLESAAGGTVFLDELGEIPVGTQVKLLRVLEEKSLRRVGGTKTRTIDVRFIAATNRDLEAEVKAGRFRQDLFFRVAAMTLQVPPLRERPEELEPLVKAFVAQHGRKVTLSGAAMARLANYAWPGNIRELKNVIERAVLLCDGRVIEPEQLPLEKMGALWLDATPAPLPSEPPPPAAGDDAEKRRIVEALAACAGNQTQAAQRLGVSRRTLIYRLDAYGLPRPVKKVRE